MKRKVIISAIISVIVNLIGFVINLISYFQNGWMLLGTIYYGGEYSGQSGFGLRVDHYYPMTDEFGNGEKEASYIHFAPGNLIVSLIKIFLLVLLIAIIIGQIRKIKRKGLFLLGVLITIIIIIVGAGFIYAKFIEVVPDRDGMENPDPEENISVIDTGGEDIDEEEGDSSDVEEKKENVSGVPGDDKWMYADYYVYIEKDYSGVSEYGESLGSGRSEVGRYAVEDGTVFYEGIGGLYVGEPGEYLIGELFTVKSVDDDKVICTINDEDREIEFNTEFSIPSLEIVMDGANTTYFFYFYRMVDTLVPSDVEEISK